MIRTAERLISVSPLHLDIGPTFKGTYRLSPTIRRELEIFPSPASYIQEEEISKFFLVGSFIREKYDGNMKKYAPLYMSCGTWKNCQYRVVGVTPCILVKRAALWRRRILNTGRLQTKGTLGHLRSPDIVPRISIISMTLPSLYSIMLGKANS